MLFASLLIVPFLDLPDYKYGCQQDRTVKNGNGSQGKYPIYCSTIAQPLDGAPIIRNLTRDLEYARTVADYMKRNATSSPEEDGIVSLWPTKHARLIETDDDRAVDAGKSSRCQVIFVRRLFGAGLVFRIRFWVMAVKTADKVCDIHSNGIGFDLELGSFFIDIVRTDQNRHGVGVPDFCGEVHQNIGEFGGIVVVQL